MVRHNHNGGIAEIDSLPGTSQVGVVHAAFVMPHLRGKRIGSAAHWARLFFMRFTLGYDYALACVDEANIPQNLIMKRAGWSVLDTFKSSKTEHTVVIYGRKLNE